MSATKDDGQYVGILIDGTGVRGALVSGAGEVLSESRTNVRGTDPDSFCKSSVSLAVELRDAGRGAGPVAGIGLCVPGLVNLKTNRVELAPSLPGLADADLAGEIARETGSPVVLNNDANAAAYGEFQVGAGRGASNLFMVVLGSGIGAGIILNGRVYRGESGFAGEFGHITIDPEGIECACGNIGCLETVASAPNIVRRTRERLYRDRTSSLSKLAVPRDREFTAEDIAHAAHDGDEMAVLMMERTGMFLGIGLAAVINLLNPDTIVVAGSVMEAGTLVLNAARKEAHRRAFPPCFLGCKIVLAELGLTAPLIGAALLARDRDTGDSRQVS
jgi:glucokinase